MSAAESPDPQQRMRLGHVTMPRRSPGPAVVIAAGTLLIALVATGFARVADARDAVVRGLVRTVGGDEGSATLVTDFALPDSLPAAENLIRWRGFWYVAEASAFELHATTNGSVTIRVDDERVLTRRSHEDVRVLPPVVSMESGVHAVVITARLPADGLLDLRASAPDSWPYPLSDGVFLAERPSDADLERVDRSRRWRRVAFWAWWLAVGVCATTSLYRMRRTLLAILREPRIARIAYAAAAFAYVAFLFVWFRDPGLPATNALRAWRSAAMVVGCLTIGMLCAAIVAAGVRIRGMAVELRAAIWMPRSSCVALAALVAVAAVTLSAPLFWPVGAMDADTTISALAGKHIADGRIAPAFYYGTFKSGTISSHVVALRTALFGASTTTLMEVTRLTYLLLMVVVFLLVRMGVGAVVAVGTLVWFAFPPLQLALFSAHNEYLEPLVFVATTFLLGVSILSGRLHGRAWWFVLGSVMGLGMWSNPLTISGVIALVFVALTHRGPRRLETAVVPTLAGALLGYMPALIGMGAELTGLAGFLFGGESGAGASPSPGLAAALLDSLGGMFSVSFPVLLLGFRHAAGPTLMWAIAALMVVVAAVAAGVMRTSQTRAVAAESANSAQHLVPFILTTYAACHFAVFWLSPFRSLVFPPRYLLPIYLGLLPLAVLAVWMIARRVASSDGLVAALTFAAVAGIAAPGFVGTLASYEEIRRDDTAIMASLEILGEAGIDHCEGPYWDAYRITHATLEATICNPSDFRRVPFYRRMLQQRQDDPISPFVSDPVRTHVGEGRRRWLLDGDYSYETLPTPYFRRGTANPARAVARTRTSSRL
ncbi:MAG: hypothetical protein GKS06_03565 [Acidobacteria bacterium]|nr:hypothetical protein [Acidobacteriota bacterium]